MYNLRYKVNNIRKMEKGEEQMKKQENFLRRKENQCKNDRNMHTEFTTQKNDGITLCTEPKKLDIF